MELAAIARRPSRQRSGITQNALCEFRQSGATLERAGLQQALELFDGLFLGDSIHQRDFSAEAAERRHVQLPFAKTLAGIALSEKIASDLRDCDDISGVDFAFIFLSKAGPVAAAFPGRLAQNLFHSFDRGEISTACAFGRSRLSERERGRSFCSS